MNTIQLNATDRAARGRNGWFLPATIEVSTSDLAHGRGIIVAVNSRARAGFPPIYFELAPEHARQLAAAILQQTESDLVAQVQAADTQIAALIGGQEMVSNLDLFARAGKFKAYDLELPIYLLADGLLSIEFVTITGNAKVSAIGIEK